MIRASNSSAPTIEPTTIPAIAPPLNPPPLPATAAAEALELAVDDGVRAPIDVVMGSSTLSHRVSVLEVIQHESVEFGELLAQYEHRLGRLSAKPQLLGSFDTPWMQVPLFKASAGSAHVVKSARIWAIALSPVVPHTSSVEAICSSLVANSACQRRVSHARILVVTHGSVVRETYASVSADWAGR